MYVPFYKSKDFQPNSHSPRPLIHSYVLNTYRRSSRAKTNHRYSGSATIGKLGTTDRYASPIHPHCPYGSDVTPQSGRGLHSPRHVFVHTVHMRREHGYGEILDTFYRGGSKFYLLKGLNFRLAHRSHVLKACN